MFATVIDCAGRALTLDRPRIAGIINVTPDSFSDGGDFLFAQSAIERGLLLAEQGADLLDIGGESTRPGAQAVDVKTEIERVVPVIAALAQRIAIPIAIDTSKPDVMRAAVAAGAGMINDVFALRKDGALNAAAELKVPVCLMHMRGAPESMQDDPQYDDVVSEVRGFLAERMFACEMSGIDKKRLIVDPGFGFGKSLEHNLALLRALDQFAALGVPLMVGLSRKGMIGALTGRPTDERDTGSAAAAMIAVQRGAMIVRVHDVAATRDTLSVWAGVSSGETLKRTAAQKPFGSQRFGDD